LGSFDNSQAVGRTGSGWPAPGGNVGERRDKLIVKLVDVGLVLNRGQSQPLSLVGPSLG
jgi:hypothetical protein